MQAKGISKQDPEANTWDQERCELGVEKAPQWGTLYFVPGIYHTTQHVFQKRTYPNQADGASVKQHQSLLDPESAIPTKLTEHLLGSNSPPLTRWWSQAYITLSNMPYRNVHSWICNPNKADGASVRQHQSPLDQMVVLHINQTI